MPFATLNGKLIERPPADTTRLYRPDQPISRADKSGLW